MHAEGSDRTYTVFRVLYSTGETTRAATHAVSGPYCVIMSRLPGTPECTSCGRTMRYAQGEPDPTHRRCVDCSTAPQPGWPLHTTGSAPGSLVALASALMPSELGELGRVASNAGAGATGAYRGASAPAARVQAQVRPQRQRDGDTSPTSDPVEAATPGTATARDAVPPLATLTRTQLSQMRMPALRALARREGVMLLDAHGRKRKRRDIQDELRARLPRRRRTQDPRQPKSGAVSPRPVRAERGCAPCSAPNTNPASGGLGSSSTNPSSGGLGSTPDTNPASGGLGSTPDTNPASGGLGSAPDSNPAIGPASGGLGSTPDVNPASSGLRASPSTPGSPPRVRQWQPLCMPGVPEVVTRDAFIAKHTDRNMVEHIGAVVARLQRSIEGLEMRTSDEFSFARVFLPPELLAVVEKPTNAALARMGQPKTTVQELVRFIQTTLAMQLLYVTEKYFFQSRFHAQHMLDEDRFDQLRQCVCAYYTPEPGPLTPRGVDNYVSCLTTLEDTVATVHVPLLLGSDARTTVLTIDGTLGR